MSTYIIWIHGEIKKKDTCMDIVFTVCIWTERPEQTVDLDKTLQNVMSHQGLHSLPLIQQVLDTRGSKLYLFKF